MSRQTGVRALVINALVAALYIVLAVVPGVFNLASGAIQFRVSEGLNHLVAFNRKYLLGVVVGCVAYNAIFSPMGWVDVVFGGGQTLIALSVAAWVAPHLTKLWQKLTLTTGLMTVTMVLVAIAIVWTGKLNWATTFWPTYGSLMLSELVIMVITAPIMAALDRILHFNRVIE